MSSNLLRSLVAGLAGGVAWMLGLTLLFGPAQAVLANPAYQSEKFLYVMTELEPLPRAAEAPWILPVGLLVIGAIFGVVYGFVRRAFPARAWWKKGLAFGAVAWALMVPWFSFYLPWNVMREPAALVLLEWVLWMGVLLLVGVAIAGVYEWRLREAAAPSVESGGSPPGPEASPGGPEAPPAEHAGTV